MSFYFADMNFQSDVLKQSMANLKKFPLEYNRMLARAVNRASKGVITDASSVISKRYRMKVKDIKKPFSTTKASYKQLETRIRATYDKAQLVSNFGAKQTKKGVRFKILKAGKSQFIRGAFIAPGKNSKKPIAFIRTDDKRYPIKAIYTTSGFDILKDPLIQNQLIAGASKRMLATIEQDTKYRLEKLSSK